MADHQTNYFEQIINFTEILGNSPIFPDSILPSITDHSVGFSPLELYVKSERLLRFAQFTSTIFNVCFNSCYKSFKLVTLLLDSGTCSGTFSSKRGPAIFWRIVLRNCNCLHSVHGSYTKLTLSIFSYEFPNNLGTRR